MYFGRFYKVFMLFEFYNSNYIGREKLNMILKEGVFAQNIMIQFYNSNYIEI